MNDLLPSRQMSGTMRTMNRTPDSRRRVAGLATLLVTLLAAGTAAGQPEPASDPPAEAETPTPAAPADQPETPAAPTAAATPTAAPAPAGGSSNLSAAGLARPLPRGAGQRSASEGDLSDYERALGDYAAEVGDYRATIQAVIESEYARRRSEISQHYTREIETARAAERAQRAVAIADFEQFLARYPNDAEFTPDVMFRYAELLFEKGTDDYEVANLEYARLEDLFLAGIVPELPDPPEYNYRPTIDVFTDLIARFPNYRQIDGVYYLLGASYDQMGEEEDALTNYRIVGEQFATSMFAQEAWLRIGEYHFDYVEYEEAREAYTRAISYGESQFYDKSLFKLGWSNYLLGDYEPALGQFRDLLVYYERRDAESGNEQRDLEEETLQYYAVTLAEEDWDLDGEVDRDFILPRIDRYIDLEAPYAAEVLSRLAARLDTIERIDASAQVYRMILARYPLDPENPRRHDTLVRILGRGGFLEEAMLELARLGELYGPDSAWYQEQERLGNVEEIAFAESLVRGGLLESASQAYNDANRLAQEAAQSGDPIKEAQAIEQFRFAARLYSQFLDQYPNVDESYETRMYLAQALYFSTQYEAAAEAFEGVRDSELSDEYRDIAANQAVLAWAFALRREIDAGRLEARALPGYGNAAAVEVSEGSVLEDPEAGDTAPRGAPAQEPIPDLSMRWASAADRYFQLGIVAEDDADRGIKLQFASGRLFYEYKHYDPARERFVAILDACRPIDETGFAAAFIIESYARTNDVDGLRFWSGELDRRAACVPENLRAALAEDLQSLAMGELARRAEELLAEGRFAEAAEEYERLSGEYADNREMAPRGLFNAGLIFEQNLSRYEAAIQRFERLVREYPESEYMDDSLVRIAVNAEKFFDFEKAITTYMQLHEMDYSDASGLQYPVLDAAELLEYSGRNREAADAYLVFADAHPDDERAPRAVYTAGVLLGDAGDTRRMLDTFERFRRTYGSERGNAFVDVDAAYIDTLYRTAKYYEERNDSRNADRFFADVLSEFNVRQPEASGAKYAAGEAAYRNAMRRFETWNAITLGETVPSQRRGIEQRVAGIQPTIEEFNAVGPYGSADWSVCALYMQGRVFQEFSDLLFQLPMPDSLTGDIDAEDEYTNMLEETARPFEDQAIAQWADAYLVMQQLGVVNECVIDTTRRLNRFRGAQYPILKQSIEFTQESLFSPQGFAMPPSAVDDGAGAGASDPFGED